MKTRELTTLGNIYDSLLLERRYHYSLPKKDKRQIMYDFYIISFLDQFNLSEPTPGRKLSGFGDVVDTPTMRYELDENTKDSFNIAKEKILNYLKPHLLSAVFFGVCAEFRHVFDENRSTDIIKFFRDLGYEKFIRNYATNYKVLSSNYNEFMELDRPKQFERYEGDNRGYLDSYKAVKQTKITAEEFINIAEQAFLDLVWQHSYGGVAWSNICKGWKRLHNASTDDEKFVAIDHVYDLQHNTDTVLNKVRSYFDKIEGFQWIGRALDDKANVQSPYQLLDKGSNSLKPLALRILKSEGYETWQGFIESIIKHTSENYRDDQENKSNTATQVWNGGTWKRGGWSGGTWNKGIWEKGVWNDGIWKSGTWKRGGWKGGTWNKGIWEKGVWSDGIWKDGTWENGIWENGEWRSGNWEDGSWNYGTWKSGTWEDGVWNGGTWKKGAWLDGRWREGVWDNGNWVTGDWMDGIWKNGKWLGGVWKNGTWLDGYWRSGTWEAGTWEKGYIFDPDRKGNYDPSWEVVDKIWIKSPISPAEYWKKSK